MEVLDKISSFKGEYAFLSNFFNCPVVFDGITYRNSEAAYQAQKYEDPAKRVIFSNLSPLDAKRIGRKIKIRPDWDDVRVPLMWEILYCKFSQNPTLKYHLIQTGDRELEEGNDWGDYFWGVCRGHGQNVLGQLLMMVRYEMMKYDRLRQDLETTGTGSMKCFGNSMLPVLYSGSKMTFVKAEEYKIGDYVFCKVRGSYIDCHVLTKKDRRRGYMISNMDGWDNGWTHTIYGKAVQAELDGKIYWRA